MASDNVAALVAIVGPTGTGKSELSLQLAERLGDAGTPAEIVNADAMQLYRSMDIGTAKLTPAERRGIPHHMLDVLEVTDESTVAAYQRDARAAIDGIRARSALPILVGGSGLYVSSVLYDLRFPGTDPAVRGRIETELERLGADAMFQRLSGVDPAAAASIDPRNARRLVRALEVIELTGEPFSASLPGEPAVWMPATVIGLRSPRQDLTSRLDERVSSMWRHGLVDEVRSLIPKGIERGVTASRAIGYAQVLAQIRGAATEEEAVSHTRQLTRRYARRQMSWFNRYPSITWYDAHAPGLVDRVSISHHRGLSAPE